jgi:hypothetical protein
MANVIRCDRQLLLIQLLGTNFTTAEYLGTAQNCTECKTNEQVSRFGNDLQSPGCIS